MHEDTLIIDRRFNGPPRSGNGGYVAGLLAHRLGGNAVVRLMAPLPLERPLAVLAGDDTCVLLDGDQTVARAVPGTPSLAPPAAPDPDAVAHARARFPRGLENTYPHCFVCGHERAPGDGLRVLPAPLEDGVSVVAEWTPEAGLADAEGVVHPAFVWAALDCPGAFAIGFRAGEALLLGEMSAALHAPVVAERRYMVLGWRRGVDRRKHFTGTAVYDGRGRCLAVAAGTWFQVPAERIA